MDRLLWQLSLQDAERDVAAGRRHVARQKEIVAALKGRDSDTAGIASGLLAQFESIQALHIAHRDRLRKELGIEAPPPSDSRI